MFRTTFDSVVKDSSALYNLLSRHITGSAMLAIVPCVYSNPDVARCEEAMGILKARYGSQNYVINAHKKILMNGKLITDRIADFEVLTNELKTFHPDFK